MLPRKEYFPRSIVIASEPEEESKISQQHVENHFACRIRGG